MMQIAARRSLCAHYEDGINLQNWGVSTQKLNRRWSYDKTREVPQNTEQQFLKLLKQFLVLYELRI